MTSTTATPATPNCPAGHGPMRERTGKTGPFFSCSTYPACRQTLPVGLDGIACPQCGAPVVERTAKKSGKPFWPCGNRACSFVAWERPHLCSHGAVCLGAERPRMTPDAVRDPAITDSDDTSVPF